jgi:choline dehydrogenase-like flavoprotein
VTLADEKDQYGLPIPRICYSWGENDKTMIRHALDQMSTSLALVGAKDIFRQDNDMNHLAGAVRMEFTPEDSVINADCRSGDIPNLFVCDGSVFPTTGGVNPSLTITAIAMRTAVRIGELARCGDL